MVHSAQKQSILVALFEAMAFLYFLNRDHRLDVAQEMEGN